MKYYIKHKINFFIEFCNLQNTILLIALKYWNTTQLRSFEARML